VRYSKKHVLLSHSCCFPDLQICSTHRKRTFFFSLRYRASSSAQVWTKMLTFVADLSKAKKKNAKMANSISGNGLRAFFNDIDKDG
jgi:hypothetical protein